MASPPTTASPADLISRGIDVCALPSCQLWWDGPEWLRLPSSHWPSNPALPSDLPEVRTIKLTLVATAVDNPMWILKRYSNWFTLLRVTALVRRFLSNCKAKISNKERVGGFVSMEEINSAKTYWTARSQSESFPHELSSLKAGKLVHHGSCLKALSPFIDDQGLIRVGDIAILKNELLPPLQWPLVRITEVHPGQDGIVRAVTVRYSSGQQFSRPVVKLAFLPTHEDEDGA